MNFETRMAQFDGKSVYQDDEEQAGGRKRWLLVGAILLVGLILVGAYYAMHQKSEVAKPAAGKEDKQVPHVTVVVPGKQLVENMISTTGTLAARHEMPIGAVGEGGVVSRVWVDAGQWVQAGQVLASIDRSVQAQEQGQLAASVAGAQADARLAQSEVERAKALAGRGFISKADIERKEANRDAAVARVRVALAQLGANRARIRRLDIRAPASGFVLARNVELGQVVGPGGGALFRLARGGELEMRAEMAEGELARMNVGYAATVVPVGTTTSYSGRIWQLSPTIDPQTRQGMVRIALPFSRALRPGGFASAQIASGASDAPLLPEKAVQSDAKGNYVYTVDAANKVVRRDISVGSVSERGVAILAGLDGSEKVVLSAGGFLNPGETVVATRASASDQPQVK
jgi:HlyD family secretion protein